ncbi:hypothetical protein Q5752_006936 [Cryptotrichosporon argae]
MADVQPAGGPAAPEPEPAPRVIDQSTDLTTLTDQEIMRLQEGMLDDEVTSRPLVSAPTPLAAIRAEYVAGSPTVLAKLDWLERNGWDQVWRARGDGDCFYRSFALAFLLRILHAPDRKAASACALEAVTARMQSMEDAGFQRELFEEFLEPLTELIKSLAGDLAEWDLVQALQDPETSNAIVVSLRLITSAYIRACPDAFAPFLLSPQTFLPLAPADYCRQEVEPVGRDADHAMILALARALGAAVRVAYLDRSEVRAGGDGGGGDAVNWVEFGEEAEGAAPRDSNDALTLLYRPGHYDVVTQDPLVRRS